MEKNDAKNNKPIHGCLFIATIFLIIWGLMGVGEGIGFFGGIASSIQAGFIILIIIVFLYGLIAFQRDFIDK